MRRSRKKEITDKRNTENVSPETKITEMCVGEGVPNEEKWRWKKGTIPQSQKEGQDKYFVSHVVVVQKSEIENRLEGRE